MRRALALGVAALLLTAAAAEAAPTRRASRAGLRNSRIDAVLPPEESRAPPPLPGQPAPVRLGFTLDLLVPLFLNSNPATLAGRPDADFEAHPGLRLGWTGRARAPVPLRLDALVDTSTDRFRRTVQADADTLLGRLRLQYESGRNDQELQPFVSFQSVRDFRPGFAGRLETRHDLAAGASIRWNFGRDGRRVRAGGESAKGESEGETVWSISMNALAQRRFAAPFPGSWAVVVNPGLAWTPTPRLSVSAEVEITRRHFDRQGGAARRDWLALPVLTLDYVLPDGTLPAGFGSPAVSLQLFLARQSANQPGASFTQYGAGPILRTSWRF